MQIRLKYTLSFSALLSKLTELNDMVNNVFCCDKNLSVENVDYDTN